MKKIINRKMYDTDTSTFVAEWSNDYSTHDFKWCVEKLYRKKTGEYFIEGEGGPMSKYAETCGNSMIGGKDIIPLSKQGALYWGESKMNVDEYVEEFGEVEE